jgi:hypothetical protein
MDRSQNQSQNVAPESGSLFESIRNKIETKAGKLSTSALIVMGALTLSACADKTEGATPDSSTSAQPAPTAETTKPVVELDVTKLPEDVIEYNLFETLSSDQQAEILSMKQASVEEFRQLDPTDQSKFSYFVFDNNIDILKYRLDETGQSGVYKNANFETAQGMRKNEDLKLALLASLKTMTPENGIAFDKDTALKASFYLNQENNPVRQQNLDAEINSWNINTPAVLRPVVMGENAVLSDGKVVSNEMNGETQEEYQNTYAVIDVPLITDETRKDSVVELSVNIHDPRYIHNLSQQPTL